MPVEESLPNHQQAARVVSRAVSTALTRAIVWASLAVLGGRYSLTHLRCDAMCGLVQIDVTMAGR